MSALLKNESPQECVCGIRVSEKWEIPGGGNRFKTLEEGTQGNAFSKTVAKVTVKGGKINQLKFRHRDGTEKRISGGTRATWRKNKLEKGDGVAGAAPEYSR